MLAAVGQGFDVLGDADLTAELVGRDEVFHPVALYRFAVDMQDAADHLDAVAGQSDDPLDVVGLVVARQLEHRDVARSGLV